MAKKIIMLQERRKEESCCLLKIHIELTSVLIWKLHFFIGGSSEMTQITTSLIQKAFERFDLMQNPYAATAAKKNQDAPTASTASAASPAAKKNPYASNPYAKPGQTTTKKPDVISAVTTPNASPNASPSPGIPPSVVCALNTGFGKPSFRPHQTSPISSLCSTTSSLSVAVFWATGSGKSLVYQLPALWHRNEWLNSPNNSSTKPPVTVVISPLISLMQDQVNTLNATVAHSAYGKPLTTMNEYLKKPELACFLGSSQVNANIVNRVKESKYTIVFCTPEYISGSATFDDLNVVMLAIDESHCVSEWGHDFRPAYRNIRQAKERMKPRYTVALTATAVRQVQEDIVSNLGLKNPVRTQTTFDRPNLAITVKKKSSTLDPLDIVVKEVLANPKNSSCIVYCRTRGEVEKSYKSLQSKLGKEGPIAVMYHAGLSDDVRESAHKQFLTGEAKVCVATIAFGMGIDKADVRRIVHLSPPKSVEEYVQQIGRAGRDGQLSHVDMYYQDHDFVKFDDAFYHGKLQGSALAAFHSSLKKMTEFASDTNKCRRVSLMEVFGETPKFTHCNNCDNCLYRQESGGEIERRDFTREFALLCVGISCFGSDYGASMTQLNSVVISCKSPHASAGEKVDFIKRIKQTLKGGRKFTGDRFKNFLSLANKSPIELTYLEKKTSTAGGRSMTYVVHRLTQKGSIFLNRVLAADRRKVDFSSSDLNMMVVEVPPFVRDHEKEVKKKVEEKMEELKEFGVDVSVIPKEEIDEGEGFALKAMSGYTSTLKRLAVSDERDKTNSMEELQTLKVLVFEWRLTTALVVGISPVALMNDSLLYNIVVLANNSKIAKDAIIAQGITIAENYLDELLNMLDSWSKEFRPRLHPVCDENKENSVLVDYLVKPKAWTNFVYKPVKKTGEAFWESSWKRFQDGESLQTIALAREKALTPITIFGHVLKGLEMGREVDLKKLMEQCPRELPSLDVWEEMECAFDAAGVDIFSAGAKEPSPGAILEHSPNHEVSSAFSTPYVERTDAQKEITGTYGLFVKLLVTFKRTGVEIVRDNRGEKRKGGLTGSDQNAKKAKQGGI